MFGLLLAVLGLFAVIIAGSLHISDFTLRHILIGCLSSAALVSMFASPLFVIVCISTFEMEGQFNCSSLTAVYSS